MKQQQGAFTVELVFAVTILIVMVFFIGNLSMLLTAKNQVDRVSYSLVTALKERKRFFNGRKDLSQTDFNTIKAITGNLLQRTDQDTQDDYGLTIESLNHRDHHFVTKKFTKQYDNGKSCTPQSNITLLQDLMPVRSDGVTFPIYQVTVCLRVKGISQYFPALQHVSSSSILTGR
ncbi:tight adherence pilus pseudopilin TadF [Vibrio mediterranei]